MSPSNPAGAAWFALAIMAMAVLAFFLTMAEAYRLRIVVLLVFSFVSVLAWGLALTAMDAVRRSEDPRETSAISISIAIVVAGATVAVLR